MTTILVLSSGPSMAETLVVPEDELPRLKACEQRFCAMVLKREPAGEDFQCKLSKTWAKDTLKGGETKTVRWGFGDARCKLNFSLARSEILSALTKPEHTLQIPSQTVRCEVDRSGELKPVIAKLAPKFVFKNGQAEKVWINLTELDGPADIKGTIWTAANLEDTLGIFHGSMIKSINKFLHMRCNNLYGPAALAKAERKQRIEKRRAALAARAALKAQAGPAKQVKPASATVPAAETSPNPKPAEAGAPAPSPSP